MSNPFEGHERTDDPAPAALSAAVDLARTLGLPVDQPRVLSDGFWLMVHVAPSPVVARVSTYTARMRRPIEYLARELAVCGFLHDQGVPVVSPSAEVSPGPHQHRDHHIAFFTHLERSNEAREPDMDDCLAMIPQLHQGLAGFDGDLSTFGPVNDDLEYCLPGLERADDLLTAQQLEAIRAADRRLLTFRQDPPGDVTVVHGDLHPGNLVPTSAGPVWVDLEDVCRAPREWDLALISWYTTDEQLATVEPDPAVLEDCRDLRALHILAGLIRFRGVLGQGAEYDSMITGALPLLTETRELTES